MLKRTRHRAELAREMARDGELSRTQAGCSFVAHRGTRMGRRLAGRH